MTALDAAVVGMGWIGTVQLQALRAIPGVDVVAGADPVADRRRRARDLGVDRTYEGYEALLADESPDVVVVATPPFLHAEVAGAAARGGAHVFVEKPLARTAEEARGIVEVADAHGVSVGVDHSFRFRPDVQRVKRAYDEGTVGHVPVCSASKINNTPFSPPPVEEPPSGWRLDPELTGGGAVVDLGVHLFDALEWLFGDLEVRHAELDRQLSLPYEDTACVVLRSVETDTVATVTCGFFQWQEPPDINAYLRLEGVADTLDSREHTPDRFVLHAAESAARNVARRAVGASPSYFGPTYFYRAHFASLEGFVEAVASGDDPPVSGRQGLRTLELAERVYEVATDDAPERTRGRQVTSR